MKIIKNKMNILVMFSVMLLHGDVAVGFNPHPNLGRDIAAEAVGVIVISVGICYGLNSLYRYFQPDPEKVSVGNQQELQSNRVMLENVVEEIKESAKLFGLCVGAGTAYGILHDQVTYRLCPEYFTKGFHKRMMDQWKGFPLHYAKKLFDDNPHNPTLRAAIWGTVASWWMGAILGIPITIACRLGSWPKLGYKDIVRPMAVTMGLTGVSSALSGWQEHNHLLVQGLLEKPQRQASLDSEKLFNALFRLNRSTVDDVQDKHGFDVNLAAHGTAYAAGPFWSLGLIAYILKKRYGLSKQTSEENMFQEISDQPLTP